MAKENEVTSQLCRLCLQKAIDCTLIFACDEEGNSSELPEITKKCLDIEIHFEDGYTNFICQKCKTLLLAFNHFKESCQESQQRLRWMDRKKRRMELREISEKMIVEQKPRLTFGGIGSEEVPASPRENDGYSGDVVRPLAIWAVSQDGRFRANTTNIKEEIIVSELLDEMTPTEGASMQKEVAVEEFHSDKNLKHLEHHNYCSRIGSADVSTKMYEEKATIAKEETKMAEEDTTMAEEEEETTICEEQTTIAEEEEWIKAANEDRSILLKSLKVPPRVPSAIKQTIGSKMDENSSMMMKDSSHKIRKTNEGVERMQNADGECKKKILISQNSKQVMRIPAVQAKPINDKNQEDQVLKVSMTLQHLDEKRGLKQSVILKCAPKAYKTLLLSKRDETVKIVRDRSGKSNICLVRIKQKSSTPVTSNSTR